MALDYFWILVGVVTLGWGLHLASVYVRSERWPVVEAEIIDTVVVWDDLHGFPGLRYEYRVQGSAFTGSILRFTREWWFARNNFTIGSTIRIRHDPRSPARSCLEWSGRSPRDSLVTVFFGLLFIATGLWRLVSAS